MLSGGKDRQECTVVVRRVNSLQVCNPVLVSLGAVGRAVYSGVTNVTVVI